MQEIALSMKQIQEQLEKLQGWGIEDNRLEKIFRFENFEQASEFISKLSSLAKEVEYYPNISWQENTIKLFIFNKKINALSLADFSFAEEIDKL